MTTVYGGDPVKFDPGKRVPDDYVCVIHPALVNPLLEQWTLDDDIDGISTQDLRLLRRLGRRVFVIPHAPEDRVEYMSPIIMRAKYHAYFAGIADAEKGDE